MSRILRLPKVIEKTGTPRSSIYEQIKLGNFPKPVRLGVRSVGWLEEEVEKWIRERSRASVQQVGA